MIHFLFLPFIPHVFSQQCGRVGNSDTSFLASLFRSHPKDTQRIIGGVKALPGAWPWQALIKYKDYIDGEKEWANRGQIAGQEYLCGGALISRRHILTAAHCVMTMNLAPTRIFLGADTANPVDTQKTVSVRAVAKSTHPLYSANEEVNPSQENDIAIITFEPAIIYSERISPVCVAGPGFNLTDFGYVTGYGAYNHGTQIIQRGSDFLQQSLLPIVDFESCSEKWKNELLEYGGGFTINDKTQICAGAVGHGSAQGDSGGPFVQMATDGKWYQVGVVSFGINTGKGYYDQALAPGIYTRVSNYCDWIAQTTWREVNCTVSSPSARSFFLGILAFISTILL